MIPQDEFHSIGNQLGVPLTNVEKDYVMGWLLWGIAQDPVLKKMVILKGGNALRKMYFSDTRFSDDLDFTTPKQISGSFFREKLNNIVENVSSKTGITFETSKTRVDEKQIPDSDMQAIDGRVYFRGIAGDSTLNLKIKFDLSPYERIILPVQQHQIIHQYSDNHICSGEISSYAIEEILAEKLRSWIQRTRPRDLFDVVKIILSGVVPISKRNILSVFLQKTLYKSIPNVGKEELLSEDKFKIISGCWFDSIVCPTNSLIIAEQAISTFIEFISALFQPEILTGIRFGSMPNAGFVKRISSAIREAIIEAGKNRKLIKMRYDNKERIVEPYSIRYQVRKTDNRGFEYFFGYDRTRGKHIKRFFLHEIQGVSIMPDSYRPRYLIQF